MARFVGFMDMAVNTARHCLLKHLKSDNAKEVLTGMQTT